MATIAAGGPIDVARAVDAASAAFDDWRRLSPAARGRILLDVADAIEEHVEELAILETLDNGKPLSESLYIDIGLVSQIWRYFGGWTTKLGGHTLPVSPPVGEALAYTQREPLGVIGAIVPWNFPLLIASWKVAPALAAGNTVVLKPSEHTSLIAVKKLFTAGRGWSALSCDDLPGDLGQRRGWNAGRLGSAWPLSGAGSCGVV